MKKGLLILIVIGIIIVGFLFLKSQDNNELFNLGGESEKSKNFETNLENEDFMGGDRNDILNWRNIELKDVIQGDYYKISDFSDKPVLLESFAVWCPTCTKQQKEIKKLHSDVGGDIVSISLNTDVNENEDLILNHAKKNGFTWIYSVSPTDFSQGLINEFGVSVVNAPSAPVILICPGQQKTKLLRSGIKSPDELKSEIDLC
jgi:thiol-disulfide isomerase/thioredoxin